MAGRGKDQPKPAKKCFRNVPVITAFNLSKDAINALGAKRFADDNGEELVSFYSHNHYSKVEVDATSKQVRRAEKNIRNVQRKNSTIPTDQQEMIWDLWPSSTGHIAGRLDLCKGMPVMIRYNEATECGITKGAEAVVIGWHASDMKENRPILDTVFVKLVNPAKDVQIGGLPVNVVPITRRTEDIKVVLPNGESIKIVRNSVPLLLNFAMTDYSSQGRTRPYNVVDLQNCKDHLSYYVALSRSATAAGTVVVQYFDSWKIRKGISGWLRQEFRELELLDEITRLRFEGKLPAEVTGNTCISLIKSFQLWKGLDYVPTNTHSSLAWTADQPMHKLSEKEGTAWYPVAKKGKRSAAKNAEPTARKQFVTNTYKPAAGSKAVELNTNPLKRKVGTLDANETDTTSEKRRKVGSSMIDAGQNSPVGFTWDARNWSCAYDSLFVILCGIWNGNRKRWTTTLRRMNPVAKAAVTGFQKISVGRCAPPVARNVVRKLLNAKKPESYPYGKAGCGIQELAEDVLTDDEQFAEIEYLCDGCGDFELLKVPMRYKINCCKGRDASTQSGIDAVDVGVITRDCTRCSGNVRRAM